MSIVLKNNASNFLAAAIDSAQTSITLQSAASFPSLGANEYFYGTIEDTAGQVEIVKVTARVGDTLTVVRAQESTSAASFAQGSRFELRVTVGSIEGGPYTPVSVNAVPRTLQEKLQEVVSVKDFGAVGDGVTDDSAAIQAANDSGAETIYFPPGDYKASDLAMTTSWLMDGEAWIVYNDPGNVVCVGCSGSNISGTLNISGDDLDPLLLLDITGDDNTFASIRCKNMQATPFTTGSSFRAAIRITGSNNYIHSVHVKDCENAGNSNESMPNAIIFSGGDCDQNTVDSLLLENIAAGIVTTTVAGTHNTVNNYVNKNSSDNGIYQLGAGAINIGYMECENIEEAGVFTGGGNANINTLKIVRNSSAVIGLQNAGDIRVGSLILDSTFSSTLVRTRAGNSSSRSLTINSISGSYSGGTMFFLTTGTVDSISISNLNMSFIYDSAVIGVTTRFIDLDGAKRFNLENWNLSIIDKNDDYDNRVFEIRPQSQTV